MSLASVVGIVDLCLLGVLVLLVGSLALLGIPGCIRTFAAFVLRVVAFAVAVVALVVVVSSTVLAGIVVLSDFVLLVVLRGLGSIAVACVCVGSRLVVALGYVVFGRLACMLGSMLFLVQC